MESLNAQTLEYLKTSEQFAIQFGGEGIQMRGGMGMTEELPVGSYVKRLMIANALFGDADHHQQRFSALVNVGDKPAVAVAAA